MATIAQHNNLITTAFGTEGHFKHVLTCQDIADMTVIEKRYPISRLPVCKSCERLGMWSKKNGEKVGVCRHCGTITYKPITLSEYYVKGHDLDGTVRNLNTELLNRKIVLPGR